MTEIALSTAAALVALATKLAGICLGLLQTRPNPADRARLWNSIAMGGNNWSVVSDADIRFRSSMEQSSYLVRRGSWITCWLLLASCTTTDHRVLVTIADARTESAKVLDLGEPGDSVGDVIVFDQPLLDADGAVIGINSGTCIRTRVGHSSQCQWTLKFVDGTIQVAGREADQGASAIAIVGGTGAYSHISGEMISVNNDDGTFTQTLKFRLR